jgi:hypothetical protein
MVWIPAFVELYTGNKGIGIYAKPELIVINVVGRLRDWKCGIMVLAMRSGAMKFMVASEMMLFEVEVLGSVKLNISILPAMTAVQVWVCFDNGIQVRLERVDIPDVYLDGFESGELGFEVVESFPRRPAAMTFLPWE